MTDSRFHVFLWTLLFLFFSFTEVSGRNDFDIFLEASRSLWRGEDIYSRTYFDGYHFYYSSLFAILLTPLTWFPVVVAKIVWILFQVWMLHRLTRIFQEVLPKSIFSRRIAPFVSFIMLVLMFRFIKANIHLGQSTILILWMTVEGFVNIQRGRFIIGGLFLAMAIDIKILPLVMVPYLMYRAQWRSLISVVSLVIIFNFLPSIFLGIQQQRDLIESRWALVNPIQHKHMFDVEETSFHSLSTVIPILFMEDSGDRSSIEVRRHICNLEPEKVKWLIHILRLSLIFGALWFLRTLPFQPAKSKEHAWWEFSYLLLCIPLIFPHQQHYAFLMAWPAILWQVRILYTIPHGDATRTIRFILLVFVFLCFNAGILLGFWRAELEHFKVVTIGAVILVFLHAGGKPLIVQSSPK